MTASVPAPAGPRCDLGASLQPLDFLGTPTALLLLFFLAPMLVMLSRSIRACSTAALAST